MPPAALRPPPQPLISATFAAMERPPSGGPPPAPRPPGGGPPPASSPPPGTPPAAPDARTEVAPRPLGGPPPGTVVREVVPGRPVAPEDPLDGIRGWLAELDRSIRMRTGIGLVLVALCIGAAAAAIYLALDSEEDN